MPAYIRFPEVGDLVYEPYRASTPMQVIEIYDQTLYCIDLKSNVRKFGKHHNVWYLYSYSKLIEDHERKAKNMNDKKDKFALIDVNTIIKDRKKDESERFEALLKRAK